MHPILFRIPLPHMPLKLWWALVAALRGSPRVLPEFIAQGKRGAGIDRELRLRRRLLAEAEA